jgi:hypothetical protein
VTAVRRLAESAHDWVAVAADPTGPRTVPDGARGRFAGYGVDVPVSLDAEHGAGREGEPFHPELPLPALVAGWLRAQAGARRVRVRLFHSGLPTADCRQERARLAGDDRAGPFDAAAVRTAGREWRGDMLHADRPFGVACHVAVWDPA